MYVLLILLIIFLSIRLFAVLYANYVSIQDQWTDANYLNITGSYERDTPIFEQYKAAIAQKGDRTTALDYYRMGSLYDYMGPDPNNSAQAGHYYLKSLDAINQQINNGHAPSATDMYVVNKLRDRIQLNALYKNLQRAHRPTEELPLTTAHEQQIQQLLHQHYNAIRDEALARDDVVVGNVAVGNVAAGNVAAGNVAAGQHWESDSQNVHDTNINKDLIRQYATLKSLVRQPQWTPSSIAQYIRRDDIADSLPTFERNNIGPAINMLNIIEDRDAQISTLDESEPRFIGTIMTYIMQEPDAPRRQVMLENLINNLKDMGPPHPVCINGRITRALSSLATPGRESPRMPDDLGILKSKQVVRNEIYARVGAVRDRVINDAPQEIIEQYNQGQETDETQALKTRIMNEIDAAVLTEYADQSENSTTIQEIRNEILSTL